MAVVLETSDQSARIGFQPGRELGGAISKERQTGLITLEGVRWRAARRILQGTASLFADPGDA
jgi:penicillin-binding protein 1A